MAAGTLQVNPEQALIMQRQETFGLVTAYRNNTTPSAAEKDGGAAENDDEQPKEQPQLDLMAEKTPERLEDGRMASGTNQLGTSRTPKDLAIDLAKELNEANNNKSPMLASIQSKTDEHIARIKQTLLATNASKKEILM